MLTVKNLPIDFEPRPYQARLFHEFFKPDPIKRAMIIWSRRMGKDKSCWGILIQKAFQRKGNYFVIFPTARQGRKAIWLGIGGDGVSFLDHIPENLIDKVNNTEMRIHLINKSVIQIIGAANYNYAMGTNPVGIVYSEYALQTPLCYTYLYPVVVENGGWLIINSTPRGHNHCYRLFNQVIKNPDWYVSYETVASAVNSEGNHIISPKEIEEARNSGMSDELVSQEFFCNWESAIENAYFAKYLAHSRDNKRIKLFPIPDKPIYTFWDIGVSDLTTIWLCAFSEEHIYLINYYQNSRRGLEFYINWLKNYQNQHNLILGQHFAPHDMAVQSFSTGERRVDRARSLGINFKIVPKPKVKMDSIEISRGIFPLYIFHERNTQAGIDALMHYHARTKPDGGETGPEHDWSSHAADSFLLIGQAFSQGMLPIRRLQGQKITLNRGIEDSIAQFYS